MIGLVKAAVGKPVLVNLIMVALFGGGLFALTRLPQEQMPHVSFPWIFVVISDPGVSPEEIEKTLTIPLEDKLKNLDDLDSMVSNSREGASFVWLKFETMDEDKFARRMQDVRTEVQKVDLPASAEDPDISQFKTQDFAPLISVIIRGDIPEHELKVIADDLREDVLDIENVSQVQISGIREREVWVEVDPARLERFGITLGMVSEAIRKKHLNLTGGDMKTGGMDYRVRTTGEADQIADLDQVIIRATPGGGHVRVRDVARVADTFEDEVTRSRFNGEQAATLTISKKMEGSSIQIIEQIKEVAEKYERDRLPAGSSVAYMNDSSVFIRDVLDTLKSNAWIGMILVAISLFVFLGWRQALFASIGIPVALATTFLFLEFTGNSVNGSTLFGLVLVLGMLVDDAVVVIENCYRYMQKGLAPRQAAIVGTHEVMAPVIVSAATTVAAFLPLMLLPGVIGDFMRIIPIVVTLALAASIFESFFILPSHVAEWSAPLKRDAHGKPLPESGPKPLVDFKPVQKLYRRSLSKAIRYRWIVLPAAFLIIIGSTVPMMAVMGVDMFADEEIPFFFGYITLPEGTNLDATDQVLRQIEQVIHEELPETDLKNVVATAGMQEHDSEWIVKPSVAQLLVELHENDVRQFGLVENMNRVRDRVELIPGIEAMEFKRISSGPPTGAPVEAKVTGEHLDRLVVVTEELKDYLRSIDGVKDIRDDFLTGVPELRVRVDEERAAMFGLSVQEVANEVYTAFNGALATQFLDGDDDIDVIVRLQENERNEWRHLADLRISAPSGARIPLKDLAQIEESEGFSTIKRDDNQRAITVSANVDPDVISGVEASQMVVDHWPVIQARHPGHSLKFGGQFAEFQEAFTNLGMLFLVGISIMLVLMAAQFNSLMQPLIIFSAIIFALWGAIIGLFLIGSPFSINNLFGLVALSGVAVNNSIVLISFVNQLRESGHSKLRALMQAGQLRVRPILLTSLTTVVGLIPMAAGLGGYSEVWGPLATIMVCGLLASSILTLFLIPLMYTSIGDFRRIVGWITRHQESEAEAQERWKERRRRRRAMESMT